MKYIRRSMENVFLKLSDEYPAVLGPWTGTIRQYRCGWYESGHCI